MIWKYVLEGMASRIARLGEVVMRMTMRLEALGSQDDRIHWVLDRERLECMVYCSGPHRVGTERRAQLHQDLYHQQHPVEEVSSRGVLWVRELAELLDYMPGE